MMKKLCIFHIRSINIISYCVTGTDLQIYKYFYNMNKGYVAYIYIKVFNIDGKAIFHAHIESMYEMHQIY